MRGLTNLGQVLNSISIDCDDVSYGFASILMSLDTNMIDFEMAYREKEGMTIIAKADYLESKSIKYEGPFAKLTVNVHTSFDLVGLTAALSAKLTEYNISANVVAGFFHDHIYVQYGKRPEAINAINSLKNEK